jgi:hypothetical protein
LVGENDKLIEAGRRAPTRTDDDVIMFLLIVTIFVLPIMKGKNVKTFVTGKTGVVV